MATKKSEKKSFGFEGNPRLKAAGQKTAFPPELQLEYARCMEDPKYFIRNYVMVPNDGEMTLMNLRDYQEEAVDMYHDNRFSIVEFARQTGKTATTVAYLLHQALFRPLMNCVILANKGDVAKDIIEKLKLSYEELPLWIQQGIKEWNKSRIILANGSKISATTTTPSSGRSKTVSILYVDEVAFVSHTIWERFYASAYPTISASKTAKIIFTSTPDGLNHWHKLVMDAKAGMNGFKYLKAPWNIAGRDEAFKQTTIKAVGMKKWLGEYECQHLGSAETLIDAGKLGTLVYHDPLEAVQGLDYFEKPQADHTYMITADIALGRGDGDFCTATVFDITSLPYKQVATYRDNMTTPIAFAEILVNVGTEYNDAWVLVENNIRSVGEAMDNTWGYQNILFTESVGRAGFKLVFNRSDKSSCDYGVTMNPKTKRVGCLNLKMMIENDTMCLQSKETVEELYRFVRNKGSWKSEAGYHDDMVMTLVLMAWAASQDEFKEFVKSDVRQLFMNRKDAVTKRDNRPAGITISRYNPDDKVIEKIGGELWEVHEWRG